MTKNVFCLFRLATLGVMLTLPNRSAYGVYGDIPKAHIEECLQRSGAAMLPSYGSSKAKGFEDEAKNAESPLNCDTVESVVGNRQTLASYFKEDIDLLNQTAYHYATKDSAWADKAKELMEKLKGLQDDNEEKLKKATSFRSGCANTCKKKYPDHITEAVLKRDWPDYKFTSEQAALSDLKSRLGTNFSDFQYGSWESSHAGPGVEFGHVFHQSGTVYNREKNMRENVESLFKAECCTDGSSGPELKTYWAHGLR